MLPRRHAGQAVLDVQREVRRPPVLKRRRRQFESFVPRAVRRLWAIVRNGAFPWGISLSFSRSRSLRALHLPQYKSFMFSALRSMIAAAAPQRGREKSRK